MGKKKVLRAKNNQFLNVYSHYDNGSYLILGSNERGIRVFKFHTYFLKGRYNMFVLKKYC